MPESPWTQPQPPPVKGPGIGLAVAVAIAMALLIGLGVWQLQRLKWKEALLAHVAALKDAPARPLDSVLAGRDLDYARVRFDCPDLERRPRLHLYGVQDGMTGQRLMVACPVHAPGTSSVLVDLGFEPTEPCPGKPMTAPPKPWPDPFVGVLRTPDARSFVTPPNDAANNLWYSRDLPAMARALNAGTPAPDFIALEPGPQAADIGACVVQRAIPLNIPNRHFEYAITWFGLAASLAAVYLAMLLRKRPR
jgi:surfeit locus 1 family protein